MNQADASTISDANAATDAWQHGAVPVVGLIGGMGAGKSWLAAGLADAGAVVIDADRVGHQVLDHPDVHVRILEEFGDVENASDPSPAGRRPIDRKALGRLAFADPARLEQLESIVHPAMRREFEWRIDNAQESCVPPTMVVLDAAVLLEARWDDLCDLIVYVDAPNAVRHARLRETRGWTDEEIRRRETAQWPADRKRSRADIVVESGDDSSGVEAIVSRLANVLRSSPQTRTAAPPASTTGTPPGDAASPAPSARRGSPPPSAQ